mgnify:CR=1 FL=1
MDTQKKDYYQYKGFLKTNPIFTPETNPFQQKMFQLNDDNYGIDGLELKSNLMLGKRAESFFKHQLTNCKNFSILKENIQIQKEKRTIGEIDAIVKDNITKKIKHIEVSYKFYLFDITMEGQEIHKWVGPNRNDNLIKKVNKLQSHQFPLLHTKEAKNIFNDLIIDLIEQEVLFKAQLFIPYPLKNHIFTSINPKAITGFHYTYSDFLKKDVNNSLFYIPEKQDWLALPSSNKTWRNFKEVEAEISDNLKKQKSPLVWIQVNDSTYESVFITWW